MQVINIRGTTSSGKTTTIKELIKNSGKSITTQISKGVRGVHLIEEDIIIIGEYHSKKFGGVDGIARIEYVEPAIMKALERVPTIIFEGLLISHSFERWKIFSKRLLKLQKKYKAREQGMIWAFIIPPFEENLKRLYYRNNGPSISKSYRVALGEEKLFNFIKRFKSIHTVRNKCKKAKQSFTDLPWEHPYLGLERILKNKIDKVKLQKKKQRIMKFL